MKILHTSDWHLGQKFLNCDRDEEHKLALDWLLECVKKEGVDLLVVAGDVFDTYNPPNAAQSLYYNFLVDLQNTNCRNTIIIGGNHDSPSMLQAPKQLLKALNVYVIGSTPEAMEDAILLFKDGKNSLVCVVAAVPYLRDRDVILSVAAEAGQVRVDRIKAGIREHYKKMAELVKKYNSEGVPILTTGHLYAQGAKTSEKQDNIYIGDISNIQASQFPKIFDYVALGHIHRPQAVGGIEHIRYSGSLIPLSFSETLDQKMVYLLEFENKKLKEIKPVDVPLFRRLKTIQGDENTVFDKIKAFAERHKNELTPWLEVLVKSDNIAPDLDSRIRELAQSIEIEILKVKILRDDIRGEWDSNSMDLSDLDVLDVFKKKCERSGVSQEHMPELENTFREVKESIDPKS